ncbi:hypothetical protein [Xanthomonas hortorum]|uniref:Uncharacterized protein n=3 Tax=Xanthomonas hortorum TaxID=56454 RepID=A0A6V7CBR9_9XANT|nr:hypothetical protein [Xanthomonas hortorum]MCE4356277.1 hypothetical protein [Xanthomonas hortorum pv. pelargonii]MCM5526659.1 hypothetical protein [Xanthomonas hortorum pv. pelargonii]MCM5538488.1 hypothetical protein [Xanthomonas hortorum pv. pelargonii]MCM5542723.1 hypothetical protein [Xanthomonas hortorum pv. pelargonii]MCM5546723.1 hypothetical protein [Xanthomonas hortorum pv. pelargonii]
MAYGYALIVDDRNASINEDTWQDLIKAPDFSFNTVAKVVVEHVRSGGSFSIISIEDVVMRRFDRVAELESFLAEAKLGRHQS